VDCGQLGLQSVQARLKRHGGLAELLADVGEAIAHGQRLRGNVVELVNRVLSRQGGQLLGDAVNASRLREFAA
jgi:hypothetical protein